VVDRPARANLLSLTFQLGIGFADLLKACLLEYRK
jgi:hypothetical protein